MMKALTLKREATMMALLGMLAMVAQVIAQTSSGTCIVLSFEQPRIPQSLIEED